MSHRIQQLTVTPDIARQTPKNEFGDVLLHTLKTGAQAGSEILGGLVPGAPVLSAAVAGLGQVMGITSVQTSGRASSVVSASSGLAMDGGGGLSSGGSVSAGAGTGVQGESTAELLNDISTSDSKAAYLELQMRMERQSEQFSALSNVLKVRSDAAKAAINNIR